MATTNLGLTQYTAGQTIKFITSNGDADYNHDMLKIDTAVGTVNTNIGTLASLKTAVKTSTVGAINEVYDSTNDGWVNTRATLTYSSTSGQNFICTTSIDLTSRVSVGMKIKLTQTTTKYFYVSAITSNSITLYGGATYSVLNATISNVYFSSVQLPYGFPIATVGLGEDFIIERGSNANGNYKKLASGELIMWGQQTVASGTLTANGGTFTALNGITLPITSLTNVTAFVDGSNNFGATVSLAPNLDMKSQVGIQLLRASSGSFSMPINYYAIGTWK